MIELDYGRKRKIIEREVCNGVSLIKMGSIPRLREEWALLRKNLSEMLDGIGLPTALDIPSMGLLFGVNRQYLHSTSLHRYPVFAEDEN